ncbi:hypothetical protein F52700_2677 [Fusarium sp. NRRL 52700]|nr:hypothetical protein F52700_2677 [Fusarium sp. NRRL 52700]
MSNKVPDHQLIKEETIEIELEPRGATRAGKAPKANNDMTELGPLEADADNGNEEIGVTPSQDSGSTAQSAQSSPSERCIPGRLGQDAESQSHKSQEVIDDNRSGAMLSVLIRGPDSIWMRDTYGTISSGIQEPFVWNDDYIRDAWPTSRDVAGVEQYLIERNGDTTETQAHWRSHWWLPRHKVATPYHSIESVWLGWCRAAKNQTQKEMSGTVGNSYTGYGHSFKGKIVVFKMCMDEWGNTLDIIDLLALVELKDLDNLGRVEELMFDNSFKRSKDYFVALQIIRIIDKWLDEVQSTVEDMFKDPDLVPASMWADGSTESFQVAIRYVNEQATAIKSRVRQKQEEINSLRDGLFNATSLRESAKAMALNQAIYVFTVVTVLFTPVSFLATFWALPFLNNPTEGTGVVPVPAAFRNSFIIMPILTYALVIGVAWFVGQRNNINALSSILRELGQSTRQLLRTGWNLRRKKAKKHDARSPSP